MPAAVTLRMKNVVRPSEVKDSVRNAKRDRSRKRRRRGFSLVELMVVIVILGMLAGVVTLGVRRYLVTSKQNIASLEISKFTQALDSFYTDFDRYPSNEEGLEILASRDNATGEAFISRIPDDPWGNPYEYITPGRVEPYEIVSYGADNREGGSGADRDIRSDELGASES